MNEFLGRLLGSNPWMDLFFGYKRLVSDSLWLRLSPVGPSNNQAGDSLWIAYSPGRVSNHSVRHRDSAAHCQQT